MRVVHIICLFVVAIVFAACGGAQERPVVKGQGDAPTGSADSADGGVETDAGGVVAVDIDPYGGEDTDTAKDDGVLATMDVIDVGTGLATFVRGKDFALLFDAGSKEDVGRGKRNRVLAFLKERHPGLRRIDHVVLSHPHKDHVNLMEDVFDNYKVANVWDVGVKYDTCPYRRFLEAVSLEAGVTFRSGAHGSGPGTYKFKAIECRDEKLPTGKLTIDHGKKLKVGEQVELGKDARMTFLYVDPKNYGDPNRNSLVVRLDMGGKRILMTGDTKGGGRKNPSRRPDLFSAEGRLVRKSAKKIRADVLVVGHHGSDTSSRTRFLDAVGADKYIMSVGRANFHGFVVPHPSVVKVLKKRGTLYRTDARDERCLSSKRKVGKKRDDRTGGCDNIRVTVFKDEEAGLKFETYPIEI